MFQFDVENYLPKFLLRDRNGYAMAKAIEAAMQYVNNAVYDGARNVYDIGAMPEWRLDEMAWEYNLIYDYTADVEIKRGWIQNMWNDYALYGTISGIVKYLESAFDTASVEEWKSYNGDPFHFRVNVSGIWSQENEEWARKVISKIKNVRSVLDVIIFNGGSSSAALLVGANTVGGEVLVTSRTL